jgi:hypothetical protein
MTGSSSTQVPWAPRTVLAVVAASTVAVSATSPAQAATAGCGDRCISVFSAELGTHADPGFIEAVLDGGAAQVGQPVGLSPAIGTDPSQDFLPGGATPQGLSTVADFHAQGLVSEEANARYGDLPAVQQRYAPEGVDTGLCVGVARVRQAEDLTLQPCDDPTTVWVVFPVAGAAANTFAIVNAATTTFRRPFAMHLPRDEVVSGDLELGMQLRRLQYRTSDRTLPARQIWGAAFGPQG